LINKYKSVTFDWNLKIVRFNRWRRTE